MAQRKSSPSASAKSGGPGRVPPAKSGAGAPKPTSRPPVKKKPGKSIVNQRQTPWGLIITTVLIVVFAAGIVTYAVASHKSSSKTNDPYRLLEVANAKSISGLSYHQEPNHDHVSAPVTYDTTPPTGGNHSYYWADCSGTVYPNAIANENAVHMLEHGAVWITYKPGLAASQVAVLSKLVTGQNYTAMSPYPGLKSSISLQAWGYQLFVDDASDARIQQFVGAMRNNSKVAPEYPGECSQPTFIQHPSTFGHPLFQGPTG